MHGEVPQDVARSSPDGAVPRRPTAPKLGAAPTSEILAQTVAAVDDSALNELLAKNPRMPLFLAMLTLNGGDATNAAAAVGWTGQYGRVLVMKHPILREIVAEAHRQMAESAIVSWRDMHQEALRTVFRSLRSPDDRVALHAALKVVERVEGKVPSRVHSIVEERKVSTATITVRFVASLHMMKGLTIAEAFEYAQRHPEEVEAWGTLQAAAGQTPELPAGGTGNA